jgi:HK97 family phage portal protein
MGIFSPIKRIYNAITTADVYGDDFDLSGAVNVVTEQTAMRQSAVSACVRLISSAMASMPVNLAEVDEDDFLTNTKDPSIWYVLNVRANRWQDAFSFKEIMAYNLVLRGAAYARIFRDSRGDVTGLVPIPAGNVQLEMLPSGALKYHVTDPTDQSIRTVNQSDMLHVRGLYSDITTPISPLAFGAEVISIDMSMSEHQDQSFGKRRAMPGGVITTEKKISPTSLKNVEKRFDDRAAGKLNAWKTIALDAGMEFSAMNVSNTDAQFLESRKFQVADVCRIFNVPPAMIQQTMDSTYSTAEQQHLSFVDFGLRPLAERFEHAWRNQLLKFSDTRKYVFNHNFKSLTRGDLDSTSKFLRNMVQGGLMTPNEARKDMNLPRFDDEGADKLYIQQNMASVDNLDNLQNPDKEKDMTKTDTSGEDNNE